MDFIKQLFYGNISPGAQAITKNSEYSKLTNSCEKLYNELKQKLSEEDMEALDKFSGANFELSALSSEEYYVFGFRDGAKMMLDVLTGENDDLRSLQ